MNKAERRFLLAESWRHDPAQMMRDAGFDPDPHQVELLTCPARNILVLWARQAGKSQSFATTVLHTAAFDVGNVLILAGEKQRQAQEVFNKAHVMHGTLSDIGELPAVDKAGDELKFGNGSRVLALPSTVDSIRGYASKLVIVDEAAFTGDDTLAKVLPMLSTTRGRLICGSTPNGATGWFNDAWHNEANWWRPDNPDGWWRTKVTVDQLPRLDPAEILRQKMMLTPLQFRQEYLLEFLDGELQFFPTETIESGYRDDIVPLFERLSLAA